MLVASSTVSLAQGYDALVRQAESKIAAREWEEALALYEKALATGEFSYVDFHNAAVACAHLGRIDEGYSYLYKAVHAGLLDEDRLSKDPDLEILRTGSRWQAVIDAVQQELEALEKACPETREAGPVVDLPPPRRDGTLSVEAALQNRRSIRSYAHDPLTIADVSQLLWAAYGITRILEGAPPFIRGGFRTAPSAGARFPLELYIAAFDVTGLPPGIYLYQSETHKLMLISEGDKRAEVSEAAFDQSHFETAAAAIVYSAVFERTTVKYGERGRERYVCMDLGHSAENVYLQAYTLKIGTCAIGAFTDLWLRKTFRMTRAEEPLYVMPLGRME
ncbi:MAG: SagB family peptide dehydrogenase [bacterium]|nr:MAG: SagB family peptide dehydrogenase [bacterium]